MRVRRYLIFDRTVFGEDLPFKHRRVAGLAVREIVTN